ncbi:frizzled-1-like [Gigantopelta aegis]|uniref:frizzled-1-like n=1 Tax=Gigantopelta aegis TaxID=1735272 RepID=UPI001B889632|nr:frizzled-1-like [Gigantopelta aegis]
MDRVKIAFLAAILLFSVISQQTIGKRRKSSWISDGPETECNETDFNYCMDYEGNITGWIKWFKNQKLSGSTLLLGLHVFPLLTQVNCSQYTQRFLCSKYFPLCSHDKHRKKIGPCKTLCDDVRGKCESKVNKAGFKWPKILRCDDLPLYETHEICIGKYPQEKVHGVKDPAEQNTERSNDVNTGKPRKRSRGLFRLQQRLKSALGEILASLSKLHDDL